MDNKITNAYECLFITDLSNGIETAEAVANKFVSRVEKNGEIIDVTTWVSAVLSTPSMTRTKASTPSSPSVLPLSILTSLKEDSTSMRT